MLSLKAETNALQYAVPGGLIGWMFKFSLHLTYNNLGVGTMVDPTLCRADRLVGQVLGAVGALPEIFIVLEISFFLLRRLLGVRTEGDEKGAKVDQLCYSNACLH